MKCCGTGLRGCCEASEQDSNIVYGFHLIPIYNRAQFVDKTDPCCSTSRRQWRVRTDDDMERYQDKAPGTPSLASAGAMHACLCSPWECRARGVPHCLCCQTGIRQIESESASLVRAVKGGLRAIRHQAYGGHCPSLQ